MAYITPNPRIVGYIVPIHGPLDEPLYMGSHIHQQTLLSQITPCILKCGEYLYVRLGYLKTLVPFF